MKDAILANEELLPTDREVPAPWPPRRIALDGASLHLRDIAATSAAAEPCVYVHGLGGSSQDFTDLAGLLTDRLDGQAIDLPGFGYSDPSRSYTPQAFADRLVAFLEHAGRGPVHLVGNSLGALVAVRVAGLRPDLVRTLTLISPAMPFLDPRRTAHGPMLPVLYLPGAERLVGWALRRYTPEQWIEQVLDACFGDPSRAHPQRQIEALAEARLRRTVEHYPRTYLGTLRGMVASFLRAYLPGDNSLWRIAARVTAPTLVVVGALDKMIDTRMPSRVANVIEDSRLLVLPGVGHVAQIEVPRMVARAIVAMLDEVSTVGGVRAGTQASIPRG